MIHVAAGSRERTPRRGTSCKTVHAPLVVLAARSGSSVGWRLLLCHLQEGASAPLDCPNARRSSPTLHRTSSDNYRTQSGFHWTLMDLIGRSAREPGASESPSSLLPRASAARLGNGIILGNRNSWSGMTSNNTPLSRRGCRNLTQGNSARD